MESRMIYCTSYCNHGHVLETGKPVEHECYVLPPEALLAEQQQDFERAAMLISQAKPLQIHRGLRGRALRGIAPWVVKAGEALRLRDTPQVAPVPLAKVLHVEGCVTELTGSLQNQGASLQDRDYYGTLHTNLLALARELEKHFGFTRGSP